RKSAGLMICRFLKGRWLFGKKPCLFSRLAERTEPGLSTMGWRVTSYCARFTTVWLDRSILKQKKWTSTFPPSSGKITIGGHGAWNGIGAKDANVAKPSSRVSRKRRTREHVIADLSANHVERHALLCGFSVERIRLDYGIDLIIHTYNRSGEI